MELSIEQAKTKFLERVGVHPGDRQRASMKSRGAATQRNKIYLSSATHLREALWQYMQDHVSQLAATYVKPVSDEQHLKHIVDISESITLKFGDFLVCNRWRIGTSQKFFNLYLKYLWCFDEIAEPPHCPIDSVVQSKADLKAREKINWTSLDSTVDYMATIKRLRNHARSATNGSQTLAVWELIAGW